MSSLVDVGRKHETKKGKRGYKDKEELGLLYFFNGYGM